MRRMHSSKNHLNVRCFSHNRKMPEVITINKSNISERFAILPYETQCKIISIGDIIYHNGLDWFYKDQNSNLNNELQNMEHLHQREIESLKSNLQYNIKSHIEVAIRSKDELIDVYSTQLKDAQKRIAQLEEETTKALNVGNKLDSLIGKKSGLDNIAKGNFGENVVWNQIMHYYPQSVLTDFSDETAHADLLWNIQTLNALIEVKNVQNVRPSDISKFERDLLLNTNNGTANCGMFVSLKTEHIPYKGVMFFEIFNNNIPVIYVSNIFEQPHNLKLALELIKNLQPIFNINKEVSNIYEFQPTINEFINNYNNKSQQQLSNIIKMKSAYDSLGLSISQEEKFINENLNSVKLLCQQLNWIQLDEDVIQDKFTQYVHFFVDFHKKNGKWPNSSDIPNYKPSVFRGNLSLSKIRDHANNLI